jgi:hypothetical protein
LTGTDGELRAFRTDADFTFADGVLATSAGAVGLTAVVAGTDGNGLTANAQPAQTLTWLDTIAIIAPTSGGEDAEDDDAYLDRLSDTRPLQLQAISTGPDIARWLRNQTGREPRARPRQPERRSSGVAGHITAVPVDSDGAALSSPTMAALAAEAQAITLTNLVVHIQAPTYTTVTVVFTGKSRNRAGTRRTSRHARRPRSSTSSTRPVGPAGPGRRAALGGEDDPPVPGHGDGPEQRRGVRLLHGPDTQRQHRAT